MTGLKDVRSVEVQYSIFLVKDFVIYYNHNDLKMLIGQEAHLKMSSLML